MRFSLATREKPFNFGQCYTICFTTIRCVRKAVALFYECILLC